MRVVDPARVYGFEISLYTKMNWLTYLMRHCQPRLLWVNGDALAATLASTFSVPEIATDLSRRSTPFLTVGWPPCGAPIDVRADHRGPRPGSRTDAMRPRQQERPHSVAPWVRNSEERRFDNVLGKQRLRLMTQAATTPRTTPLGNDRFVPCPLLFRVGHS
jgi:hypothetical protein